MIIKMHKTISFCYLQSLPETHEEPELIEYKLSDCDTRSPIV